MSICSLNLSDATAKMGKKYYMLILNPRSKLARKYKSDDKSVNLYKKKTGNTGGFLAHSKGHFLGMIPYLLTCEIWGFHSGVDGDFKFFFDK